MLLLLGDTLTYPCIILIEVKSLKNFEVNFSQNFDALEKVGICFSSLFLNKL